MDERYQTVIRWGVNLGLKYSVINNQIQEAIKDNAPENAIYKKEDGTWAVAEKINSNSLKRYILTGKS